MAITEQFLRGPAVGDCLDGIASLRLAIFREYPYLYAGQRDQELAYLQLYAKSPAAFVITVNAAGTLVGAVTGIPLIHELEQLISPLQGTTYPIEKIFYVGELLFLSLYRNQGLGSQLLATLEDHVRSLQVYRYLTCATVIRPDKHPLRPDGYVPINRFLERHRFAPLPGVTTQFAWQEVDGCSHDHLMQFWLKEL